MRELWFVLALMTLFLGTLCYFGYRRSVERKQLCDAMHCDEPSILPELTDDRGCVCVEPAR